MVGRVIAEHRWTAVSRHSTSEGTVVYESCHCGMLRVRQQNPGTRSVTFGRLLVGPAFARDRPSGRRRGS